MPRRNIVFLLIATIAAVFCARLGVWQLRRLATRRAHNAVVSSRLDAPPIALSAVPADTGERRYRRVRLAGTLDFSHEVLLVDRVRDGAPGVNFITPMHADSGMLGDTTVLVDRGWAYAADGMSVDDARWQEPSHLTGIGYLVALAPGPGPATLSASGHPNEYRWLDRAAIEQRLRHPVADYLVVLQSGAQATADASPDASGASAARAPTRLPAPPLDEGPHLNYAIQWFSFAITIIVGTWYALFIAPRQQDVVVPPRTA
jgi:surfeit locus 1 family protein